MGIFQNVAMSIPIQLFTQHPWIDSDEKSYNLEYKYRGLYYCKKVEYADEDGFPKFWEFYEKCKQPAVTITTKMASFLTISHLKYVRMQTKACPITINCVIKLRDIYVKKQVIQNPNRWDELITASEEERAQLIEMAHLCDVKCQIRPTNLAFYDRMEEDEILTYGLWEANTIISADAIDQFCPLRGTPPVKNFHEVIEFFIHL